MKTLLLSLSIMNLTVLQAQISTTKPAERIQPQTEVYDSLKNFLGEDAMQYIGQTLYLKGKSESLREYGYRNFKKDMKGSSGKDNVYKCCDSYNSRYDALNGKYFKVLDVIEQPNSYGTEFYLKLEDTESNSTLYFDYSSKFKSSFPFITVGFFEKNKELLIGRRFILADGKINESNDITTGKAITYKLGQEWKCVDLTIEEEYYSLSLVLQNAEGEKITFSYNSVYGENASGVFDAEDAERYVEAYGIETFDKMLNGKVPVGITEEMVIDTWGKPEKINRSSTGEQWVYGSQYLYFKNGKLESFN